MADLVARRDPTLEAQIRRFGGENGVRMDPKKRAEFERRLGIESGPARRAKEESR
jgi:hypothetical protein